MRDGIAICKYNLADNEAFLYFRSVLAACHVQMQYASVGNVLFILIDYMTLLLENKYH